MNQNIHFVVGHSGSYDDYRSWEVCAYPSVEAAERHADLANAWSDAARARMEGASAYASETSFRGVNPYDPVLAGQLAQFPDSGFFSGLARYTTRSVAFAASAPAEGAPAWDWTAPSAERIAAVVERFKTSEPGSLRLVDLRHYVAGSLIARGLEPDGAWGNTTVLEHAVGELAHLLRPLPATPERLRAVTLFEVYAPDAIFGTEALEQAISDLDIEGVYRHELDKLAPVLTEQQQALRDGRAYRWENDVQRARRLASLEALEAALIDARARAEALRGAAATEEPTS